MANPFRKDPDAITASALPLHAPRPLTAAAVQIKTGDKGEAEAFRRRRASSASVWQSEAWEYYDAIGEIKYIFNLSAQVLSRIRLFAAVSDDPSEAPVSLTLSDTIDPQLADAAARALARLDSAHGGQSGFLRDAALNLNVTGECYLVQVPQRTVNGQTIPESWDIRSVDELKEDADGNFRIIPRRDLISNGLQSYRGGDGTILIPPGAFMGRIWRPHPRFSDEPDSSMRGILDLASELLLLNRSFRATHRSRLNAGAIYLPDGLSNSAAPEMDFPYDEDGENVGPTPEELADEFEDSLVDAMTQPIKEEDSASAVVPLIIRGPAELGEKIKQFKFERAFDSAMNAREARVLDRILQGLDAPKDIITGLANVKYSNAQQIDDSLYKAHVEPMIMLICDAITQVYLRPYLIFSGYDPVDVARIVVWYDPSSISTRTDRAADADSGLEKNAISAATWRRAHGFSEADAPTSTEFALRLLTAHGVFSPELSEAILTAVAPELMGAAKSASQAANVAPIPGDVQNVLNGGQPTDPSAAPADPNTPDPATDSTASPYQAATGDPATDAGLAPATTDSSDSQDSTIPPDSDSPTAAGADAPPVPLT